MRILRSLLITLIVVSFSNAQESGDRSLPQEMGEGEIETGDISEPNASEIEKASSGDQRSLAALEAVKEGNDLWRSGEVEESSRSYQRAGNPRLRASVTAWLMRHRGVHGAAIRGRANENSLGREWTTAFGRSRPRRRVGRMF